MQGELLEFPGEVYGMVLNLEEDNVGAVYLVIQEMLMKAILLRQLDELLRFQLVTH